MIGFLLKKLRDLLLPERNTENIRRAMTTADLLVLLCERISQLAEQLETHAEQAPYPQVTERLRAIADEKRSTANLLKQISGNPQGSSRGALNRPPVTGKNHWERLIRDLEEQRALDDFVARYQSTLIQQVPGTADLFDRIKTMHEAHRRSLLKMVAVADPQANQS
jgi:hypothetical protein